MEHYRPVEPCRLGIAQVAARMPYFGPGKDRSPDGLWSKNSDPIKPNIIPPYSLWAISCFDHGSDGRIIQSGPKSGSGDLITRTPNN